ncbi:MAG TPA: hypothetical protein PLX79_02765 [Candidatus Dojkabacteria bacterium]|nr:hypothetical protein [Candidatus Dojkabacteria bacterium]
MKNTFSKVISSITASALLVTTLGVGSVNAFNGSSINEFGKIIPVQKQLNYELEFRSNFEFWKQGVSATYNDPELKGDVIEVTINDSCVGKIPMKLVRDSAGVANAPFSGYTNWELPKVDSTRECSFWISYNDVISRHSLYSILNFVPDIAMYANPLTITAGEKSNISVQTFSGNPPFTYMWSNGSTSDNIEVYPTKTTTYTVTITDIDGDSASGSVTITVNPAVVIPPVDDGDDDIVNPPVNPPVESKDGGSTTPVEDKSDAQKTDNKDQKNNKIIATSVKADDKDGEVLGTETSKNGLEVGDYFLIGAGVLALIGIIVGIVMFTRKKKSNQSLNQ